MDLLFPLSRRNLAEGHPSSAQEIITQIIHSLNANLLCLFPDRVAFAYGLLENIVILPIITNHTIIKL